MLTVRLLLLAMMVCDVYWVWRADRWLRRLKRAMAWRIGSAAFGAMQLGCILTLMLRPLALRGSSGVFPVPLLAAVYLWHLLILPFVVVISMVADVLAGIRRKTKDEGTGGIDPVQGNEEGEGGRQVSRRQLLGGIAAVAPVLALGATVGAALYEQGDFRIRRVTLRLEGLAAALDGLTICQVSDLHIGKFMKAAYLPAVIDAVNGLNADVIVHTGDLIDFALADLPLGIDAVRAMKARIGVVMCLGNHDVIENRDAFVRGVREAKIPLLVNESMKLKIERRGATARLQFLGISWSRGEKQIKADVERVISLRDRKAFPVLLAHHPHAFDTAAAVGLPLTISGHTHGGQLMLSEHIGAGPLMFRYWSGLYEKRVNGVVSQLFVSNGVGNWFPLRINAPAEIVFFTLQSV